MTKTGPRQLELPVMVDVNERAKNSPSGSSPPQHSRQSPAVGTGFHKPASADDQSVYKAISDNYFNATGKQA